MSQKAATFEFVDPNPVDRIPPAIVLGQPADGVEYRVSMGVEYYLEARQQIVDLTAENSRLAGRNASLEGLNALLHEQNELLEEKIDNLRNLVRRAAAL